VGADGTLSWNDLVREATARLSSALDGDRSQEARWLVERVSDFSAPELRLHGDELVSTRSVAFFDALVTRRAAGEPLQYVLGRWSFRTLELHVTPAVLIPRPETEHVVEYAIRAATEAYVNGRAPVVVDLGTGSGAIALSIAVECPASQVWASDVSPAALAVARANLAGLGRAANRVTLVEGSWLTFGAISMCSCRIHPTSIGRPIFPTTSVSMNHTSPSLPMTPDMHSSVHLLMRLRRGCGRVAPWSLRWGRRIPREPSIRRQTLGWSRAK
jgi:hypothetical protein